MQSEKPDRIIVKEIFSKGDISLVSIPQTLPYAGALERIKTEAMGTGVTIDVASFFSEQPVELHNFVSSITYRFTTRGTTSAIAYVIEDRDMWSCDYKEIDYDGNLLFTFPEKDLTKKQKTPQEWMNIERAHSILGKYGHLFPLNAG
jgi:hypothetical protein